MVDFPVVPNKRLVPTRKSAPLLLAAQPGRWAAMNTIRVPLTSVGLALLLSAGSPARAAEADIAKLAWLAGCWKGEGTERGSGEHWMSLAGDTMLGISRTVKQGKTVEFEFLQIRHLADGTLVLIAQPSGQSTTVFPLLRINETEATFENPQHDFPQRVIYRREEESKLRARIEGVRNDTLKTVEFAMNRVSCDASIQSPIP